MHKGVIKSVLRDESGGYQATKVHVVYHDDEKADLNPTSEEVVIWENGAVTGNPSRWPEDGETAAVGVGVAAAAAEAQEGKQEGKQAGGGAQRRKRSARTTRRRRTRHAGH